MIELKDELFAMHMHEWKHVPITVNHHKWWLKVYRIGDGGEFFACFVSPKKRTYCFWVERGRVTSAEVTLANGETIASYDDSWSDKAERMDAVLRVTPKHVIDRLFVLLDAIG